MLRAIELEAQAQLYPSVHHRLDQQWKDLVSTSPTLRYSLFWRAIERQRKALSAEGKRLTEWWQARPGSPVLQISADDFDIFLTDVRNRTLMDDRLIALTAAFTLWRDGGQGRKGRERMWRAVKDKPDLEA